MKYASLTDNPTYHRLLADLEYALPGQLFPVLYSDESVIPAVIEQLKSNLGKQAVFKFLEIESLMRSDALKTENAPNNERIFLSIKGVDLLSEEKRMHAVGWLQIFFDNAEQTNSSIILWITPLLERMLFFSFPEIYRKIAFVYDLCVNGVSENKKNIPSSFSDVFDRHMAGQLREMVSQYHHWQTSAGTDKGFMIGPVGRLHITHRALPLYVVKQDGKQIPLDQLFKAFLKSSTLHMLTLLGNSHIGKTSFMVKSFIRQAERYIENPEKAPVPIFIDLETAEGELAIESFLLQLMESIYRVRISLPQLYEILAKKQFVFWVSGFDQMQARTDEETSRHNFKVLSGLLFSFLPAESGQKRNSHKILIAGQPHFFLSDLYQQPPEYTSIYAPFADRKECRTVRIAPPRFDPSQVKPFVAGHTSNGITARNMLSMLNNPYYQNTLSSPSLMWEMAIRTISQLRDEKEVNIANLYSSFTRLWVEQDHWRSCLTADGRAALINRIATEMADSDAREVLHISRLPSPPEEHFRNASPEDVRYVAEEELKCCEFVRLDADGNIRFIHPSFLHYFLAKGVFRSLRNGRKQASVLSSLGEEAKTFLKAIVSSNKNDLSGLNLSGLDLSDANLYRARMADADLSKTSLTRTVLIQADLQGADLTAAILKRARMSRVNLIGADLTGADFSEAILKEAHLEQAGFNGASFRGADLRGVKLQGAKLAWVDLSGADLKGADLSGANLSDADLAGADLTDARLNDASLANANLRNAILKNTEISFADLSHADLTGADLYHANLSWSKLQNAVLTRSLLHRTRLREADLTRANLNDADLHRADGRWATFAYARLKNALIREADFTGANFQHAIMTASDLTWINLCKACLDHSELMDATLKMAKMIDARFRYSNLSRADLTWTDLTRADFSHAVLNDANLSEADLTDVVLKNTNLKNVNIKGTLLEHRKKRINNNGDI